METASRFRIWLYKLYIFGKYFIIDPKSAFLIALLHLLPRVATFLKERPFFPYSTVSLALTVILGPLYLTSWVTKSSLVGTPLYEQTLQVVNLILGTFNNPYIFYIGYVTANVLALRYAYTKLQTGDKISRIMVAIPWAAIMASITLAGLAVTNLSLLNYLTNQGWAIILAISGLSTIMTGMAMIKYLPKWLSVRVTT
jgi:hypothetical protein